MKKTFKCLAILFSSVMAFSCSSNEDIFGTEELSNTERRIAVIAEDFTPTAVTRTAFTERTDGSGYSFSWSKGDDMGIIPQSGTQIQFTISNGAGTNTAVFDGGNWTLKSNKSYAAYYPLQHNFDLNKKAIPVSYLGQAQDGNGDTRHLAQYDYMASEFTKVDAKGNVSLKLKHLGSLMQLKLTMPKADTFNKVEIVSDDAKFINEGTFDITSDNPVIKVTDASNSFRIDLKNVTTTSDNEELKINFMLAPVDYSLSQFTVTVYGSNSEYTTTFYGDNLVKGGAYSNGSNIGDSEIPYITFNSEGAQTLTMSSAVEALEYSVNGGEWKELGTNTVTFGRSNGDLRLRGSNGYGTTKSYLKSSTIRFGTSAEVTCSGDIRTLADYRNYQNEDTSDDRFCDLFSSCTTLISAPELPAGTLADYCYSSMFYHCSSLTSAPELPAETLARHCYTSMFEGCTLLAIAPELPAETLADYCYDDMFTDCSSLKSAPELPAETLANYCYFYMFYGCSSLTSAPELPAETLTVYCYSSMFANCTSLTSAPELPAETLAEGCYSGMFTDCTSLTSAPELPAETLAEDCYSEMFYGCTSLISAPELPSEDLSGLCYSEMFRGCTSLTSAPELPAVILANYCYFQMFYDCTSLTSAPALPAKTLVAGCYYGMFNNCTSLNYIKMMATDISAFNCLGLWGSSVAQYGTFVKNSTAKWDNAGVVPYGWTVKTATN